jgi:hypothetical protein
MGLDMYLNRKQFIGANYEHRHVTGIVSLFQDGKPIPVDFSKISYIEYAEVYWRKANQIHKWFVDNVQSGEDDCGTYDVAPEQLEELVSLCKEVLANPSKAAELLPTQSGFFFGGDEYDEYYFQELEQTVEDVTRLLSELDPDQFDSYYYHSSW